MRQYRTNRLGSQLYNSLLNDSGNRRIAVAHQIVADARQGRELLVGRDDLTKRLLRFRKLGALATVCRDAGGCLSWERQGPARHRKDNRAGRAYCNSRPQQLDNLTRLVRRHYETTLTTDARDESFCGLGNRVAPAVTARRKICRQLARPLSRANRFNHAAKRQALRGAEAPALGRRIGHIGGI